MVFSIHPPLSSPTREEWAALKKYREQKGQPLEGKLSTKEEKILQIWRDKKGNPPEENCLVRFGKACSNKTKEAISSKLYAPSYPIAEKRGLFTSYLKQLPKLIHFISKFANHITKEISREKLPEWASHLSIPSWVVNGVTKLTGSSDPLVDAAHLEQPIEMALLNGSEHLSKRIEALNSSGTLVRDLSLRTAYLLKDYTGAFLKARAASENLEFSSSEKKQEFIFSAFGKESHPAFIYDTPQEKEAKQEEHLQKLSYALLEVLMPKGPADVPLAPEIQEKIYDLLGQHILPAILDQTLIENLMRPDIVDTIILNILNCLSTIQDDNNTPSPSSPMRTTPPLPMAKELVSNLAYMLLPDITKRLAYENLIFGNLIGTALGKKINKVAGSLFENQIREIQIGPILEKGIKAGLQSLSDDLGRQRDLPPCKAEEEQRHEEVVDRIAKTVKTSILSPFLSNGIKFDRWALKQKGVIGFFSGIAYAVKKILEFSLECVLVTLATVISPLKRFTENYKDATFRRQSAFLVQQLSSPAMKILYFKLLDEIVSMLNPDFDPNKPLRMRKPSSQQGGV